VHQPGSVKGKTETTIKSPLLKIGSFCVEAEGGGGGLTAGASVLSNAPHISCAPRNALLCSVI
jgi:hypothetical protein